MYFDYDDPDKGLAVHYWEGEYRNYPFDGYDGMVISKRYVGQGPYNDIDHCKDPVDLYGNWYAVFIDTGDGGTFILDGKGWGKTVDVRPNMIHSREIKFIAEHQKP